MASEEKVEELRAICEDCLGTPIDELVSNPDWGKLNFNGARGSLERIFGMLKDLLALPVDILPDQVIGPILDQLRAIHNTIKQIRSFDIATGDAAQIRNGVVDSLRLQADDLFMATHAFIPYLAHQKGDAQKNINELTSATNDAKKVLADAQSEAEAKKEEIGKIVVAAREASASAGVAQFTADFSEEADALEKSADKWLWATVAFSVAVLAVATYFLNSRPAPESEGWFGVTWFITAKLVIFALLFSAAVWCGGVYKALKHQAAVNRHRATSIKTFRAIVEAAGDDATRDAVLLETTRAIFAQVPTGYLGKGAAGGGSDPLKVIEVAKQASKA